MASPSTPWVCPSFPLQGPWLRSRRRWWALVSRGSLPCIRHLLGLLGLRNCQEIFGVLGEARLLNNAVGPRSDLRHGVIGNHAVDQEVVAELLDFLCGSFGRAEPGAELGMVPSCHLGDLVRILLHPRPLGGELPLESVARAPHSDAAPYNRVHALFMSLEYLSMCSYSKRAGSLRYLQELEQFSSGLPYVMAADSLIRKKVRRLQSEQRELYNNFETAPLEVLNNHKYLWNDARTKAVLAKSGWATKLPRTLV